MMTLAEIQSAVLEGHTVYWSSRAYYVLRDNLGQWLIRCRLNGYCFGLTNSNGILQGRPSDYFLGEPLNDDYNH